MKFNLRFVVHSLFVVPIGVNAAEWYLVSANEKTKFFVLVDKQSVVSAGNTKKFWSWRFDLYKKPGSDMDSLQLEQVANCGNGTIANLYGVAYDGDNVISSTALDGEFQPAPPDSVNASTIRTVCSGNYVHQLQGVTPNSNWAKTILRSMK